MTAQLTLQPESSAAGIARRWVREKLTEQIARRPDGVRGARRLRARHQRPAPRPRLDQRSHRRRRQRLRIEVYDDSTRATGGRATIWSRRRGAPADHRPRAADRRLHLAVVGRGLRGPGKCVWFQPMPEARSGRAAPLDGRSRQPRRSDTPGTRDTARVSSVDLGRPARRPLAARTTGSVSATCVASSP